MRILYGCSSQVMYQSRTHFCDGVFHSRLCCLLQVNAPDTFYVPANARIGWTFESQRAPISFDYIEGYKVYYRPIVDGIYPEVNTEYAFQNLAFPAIFSIAAQIDISE